jgi:hypothetical protein
MYLISCQFIAIHLTLYLHLNVIIVPCTYAVGQTIFILSLDLELTVEKRDPNSISFIIFEVALVNIFFRL